MDAAETDGFPFQVDNQYQAALDEIVLEEIDSAEFEEVEEVEEEVITEWDEALGEEEV